MFKVTVFYGKGRTETTTGTWHQCAAIWDQFNRKLRFEGAFAISEIEEVK